MPNTFLAVNTSINFELVCKFKEFNIWTMQKDVKKVDRRSDTFLQISLDVPYYWT